MYIYIYSKYLKSILFNISNIKYISIIFGIIFVYFEIYDVNITGTIIEVYKIGVSILYDKYICIN